MRNNAEVYKAVRSLFVGVLSERRLELSEL